MDQRSKEAKGWRRLYSTSQWARLRAAQLNRHPLCAMCERTGRPVSATVVDHIVRHRGDEKVFFNPKNLQSLCKPCHDRHKAQIEATGLHAGYSNQKDADGYPIDPNHPANNGCRFPSTQPKPKRC